MFLSAYHFDGSPDRLLPAYHEFMRGYPSDGVDLHLCVISESGITIFDACPSRDVFEEFHRSDSFRAGLAGAGLPTPRIEPLGEVHATRIDRALPV